MRYNEDYMKISDIKPYEKNAKKHPAKHIQQVANSIKEFGMNQPIVVDKQGVIIVGHGRYEACKLLGIEPEIKVVDLTEEQAKAYRLADNKLNESEWDMNLVIEELKGLSTEMLDLTGFDRDLIIEPDEKDDVIPENVPSRSKLGDLYELGQHRVLCGDSTQPEAVLRLMDGKKADMVFTDPPYNVAYDNDFRGTKHSKIENDNLSDIAFREFLIKSVKLLVDNCGGGCYICMSAKEMGTLKSVFEEVGGHWSNCITWVKNHFSLSMTDYQHTYEQILYGWKDGTNHYFIEERDNRNVWEDIQKIKTVFDGNYTEIQFQGFKVRLEGKVKGQVIRKKQRVDIWRHDKPMKSVEHPTMKPVALCAEAIINSSKKGDIVLDTFLGSGSTLIASEKTVRICYGMELDPKYVDVIVQRYVDYTGNENIKLNGEPIVWTKTQK
jgi:DNA modification methylase